MNKIHFHKATLLFLLLFSFIIISKAQFDYKIKGFVSYKGAPLIGATISLSTDLESFDDEQTNSRGYFSLDLKPNEEYYVSISKEDFADCQMVISTLGFSKEEAKNYEGVSSPKIEMTKLPEDEVAADKIIEMLSTPMFSYYYNSAEKKMILDEILEEEATEAFAEIKNIVEQEENKENPMALVDLKYKKEIADGDRFFLAQDYEQAKISFTNALAIKANSSYPRDKLVIINKIITDLEEKERIAKETALANAAEKERIAKENAMADAAEQERLQREKELAQIAEKEKLAREKAEAEAIEKERIAKAEAADSLAAENERIAYEKLMAEKAEKERLAKEQAELAAEKARIAKEQELAEKAAAERLAKKNAMKAAAEAERIAKEKAIADAQEKERLEKEEANRILNLNYTLKVSKGDSAFLAKNYAEAKRAFNEALQIKPNEEYPKKQLEQIEDDILKYGEFENELAKNYPQGITEENTKEGNTMITRRILVQGNKGYLYVRKRTSFGAVYYFKDGVNISEAEFNKNTEIK